MTIRGNIDALIDLGAELSLISTAAIKKRVIQAKSLETLLYIIFAN